MNKTDKLEELKKKLYKPESEFEERIKKPKPFQPDQTKKKVVLEEWQTEEKKWLSAQQKRYLLIGGISVIAIFLFVATILFLRGLTSFDKAKVEIEIKAAERVVSGEEIKYLVKYQNKTRLALENVQLAFHYPDDSIPLDSDSLVQIIDLPNLAAGQEKQIELPVRIIGLKGETKKAWAELNYQPAKFSSRYTNQAEFSTTVISVPLILDFDLPERLVNGQSFNFSLQYLNQAEVSFDNLRVQIDYPAGFVFQSAEPQPIEEDRIWFLGDLMAGQEGKIFIRGNIQGEEGEVKTFNAQLGVFKDEQFIPTAETAGGFRISLSPLSIIQTVNNSTNYVASAGQTLTYQIDYKNTTDVGIKNVVITSKLEGKVLDLTSLKLGQGSFDGVNQIITWRASNLPDLEYLAPHQEGQISFSINVKDPLPVENYTDKNFIVTNTVKIDSSEAPLSLGSIEIAGQSELATKIASRVVVQAQGYYNDDLIPNSGPIPPKVGQITTYTIKWRLINVSNDLSQTRVSVFLPPHVQWLNKISPSGTDLKYNSQTGQIVWQVGDLPAATGVLLPVKQVAFQIAITPGLTHLGNLVELIGQSKVTGQDNFVSLELSNTDEPIDTDLPDDPAVSRRDGVVVE